MCGATDRGAALSDEHECHESTQDHERAERDLGRPRDPVRHDPRNKPHRREEKSGQRAFDNSTPTEPSECETDEGCQLAVSETKFSRAQQREHEVERAKRQPCERAT